MATYEAVLEAEQAFATAPSSPATFETPEQAEANRRATAIDRIAIGDDYAYRTGITIPNDVALVAWVKLNDSNVAGCVLQLFTEESGSNRYGIALMIRDTEVAFAICYAGGSSTLAGTADVTATDILDGSTMYLLAAIRKGSDTTCYVRKVDGSSSSSTDTDTTAGSIGRTGAAFTVHSRGGAGDSGWSAAARDTAGVIAGFAVDLTSDTLTAADLDQWDTPEQSGFLRASNLIERFYPDRTKIRVNAPENLTSGSDFDAEGTIALNAGTARLTSAVF